MDIKKLQEIIDKSELSDAARDLIQELMPDIDKPEVREEILRTIDFDMKMYGLAADEGEQLVDEVNLLEKKLDAADLIEEEQLDELTKKYDERMGEAKADMDESLKVKDNFLDALAKQNAEPEVQAQVSAQTPPVMPSYTPDAPVAVAPVVPVAPTQSAGFGGQQYNNTPQPAPFPTNSGMGQTNQ